MARALKALALALTAGTILAPAPSLRAANILWVSDAAPGSANNAVFSGPGSGFTDSAFVKLLQDAGYNVNRMNTPDSGNTNLTALELAAINTNDLIIVGRAAGSGAWQNNQATNWNRDVLKPVMIMSPYLVRTDGNRVGWFGNGNGILPDDTPTPLIAGPASDPVVDYIFQDVAMNGASTAEVYDEPMDRNTSLISVANTPAAGAQVIATATFPRENDFAITNAYVIVGFPAGTTVRGGLDVLPAYRMYFGGGTRESSTAPNAIPLYTGRENLTSTGEKIFLRAVEVALNSGVAPGIIGGTAAVIQSPASVTALQGQNVTLTATVTGAAPRTVQWQRNDGGGFADIVGATTGFRKTSLMLSNVSPADNGAQFQVIVTSAAISATSTVATLTVTADTNAPVPVSAASLDGSVVTVCFNELINGTTMSADPSAYAIDGGATILVTSVTPGADGKSVNLILSGPIGATATVDFFFLEDRNGNVAFSGPTIVATNLGLTIAGVGALNPAGSVAVCDGNSIQVTAGGLDIGSTADILRYVYKVVSGDFDARVRIRSFVGMTNDHFETTAKALLVARVDDTTGSADVKTWVTPPPPGDNVASATYRATAGSTNNTFGPSVPPSAIPNAWLRIQRVGDQYTTYQSTNGTDWITIGTATIALGADLHVGVGAVSHRNGKTVTATFSDFRITQGNVPVTTTLVRPTYTAGQFSASFQTQNGLSYLVEYKNDLNTAGWTTLTTIPGDGTVKSFTDPGPVSPTGNRFYRITVQ